MRLKATSLHIPRHVENETFLFDYLSSPKRYRTPGLMAEGRAKKKDQSDNNKKDFYFFYFLLKGKQSVFRILELKI